MKVSDFTYDLPEELIASYPTENRSDSRLLALNIASGEISHKIFKDLPGLLRPGDLLVFNNTRVIPARLYGQKESGGRVELLVERVQGERRVLAQLRASKSPRAGTVLLFDGAEGEPQVRAVVTGREQDFYVLEFEISEPVAELLERIGHMPLPPYLSRQDEAVDRERYQTVYARKAGAVAAPTAGLHFDDALLQELADMGVNSAYLTLHVGAGTFQPVRAENVEEHRMHREWIEVGADVCAAVNACRASGGRVVAVGTTSVRSLESAAREGELKPFCGETDIFIYPGFEFKAVDAMITNFHLPQSTLLMLVSAFSSQEMLLGAYQEAVEQRYRFFSYGDAMIMFRP